MNVFLVSRQIYQESSAIFYTHNNFHFQDGPFFIARLHFAFLQDRPPQAIEQFRHISLNVEDPEFEERDRECEDTEFQGMHREYYWDFLVDTTCRFRCLRTLTLVVSSYSMTLLALPTEEDAHDPFNSAVIKILTIKSLQTLTLRLYCTEPYDIKRIEDLINTLETKVLSTGPKDFAKKLYRKGTEFLWAVDAGHVGNTKHSPNSPFGLLKAGKLTVSEDSEIFAPWISPAA